MLIDSPFKDYYDKIKAYGIDKTVVYRRITQEMKLDNRDVTLFHDDHRYKQFYSYKTLIGFCGKIYPFAEVSWHKGGRSIYCANQKAYESETEVSDAGHSSWWKSRNQPFWGSWENLLPLFQAFKVPVFRIDPFRRTSARGMMLTLNPSLRDLHFQHVVDPPTAFQNIYMYISGVLGTTPNPTVAIDDKHKAIAHGHDGKYSFKKTPGGGQWR